VPYFSHQLKGEILMQTTTIQTGRPAEFALEAIIQAGQELQDAGLNSLVDHVKTPVQSLIISDLL
jgi:hypothetical protein